MFQNWSNEYPFLLHYRMWTVKFAFMDLLFTNKNLVFLWVCYASFDSWGPFLLENSGLPLLFQESQCDSRIPHSTLGFKTGDHTLQAASSRLQAALALLLTDERKSFDEKHKPQPNTVLGLRHWQLLGLDDYPLSVDGALCEWRQLILLWSSQMGLDFSLCIFPHLQYCLLIIALVSNLPLLLDRGLPLTTHLQSSNNFFFLKLALCTCNEEFYIVYMR